MATVALTPHLYQFFPQLKGQVLSVAAASARELVAEMERSAPGVAFYLCDERGRLRQHVNIFIDGERICDRGRLSDAIRPDSHVDVMQALSGG